MDLDLYYSCYYQQITIKFLKNVQCKAKFFELGRSISSLAIKINDSTISQEELMERDSYNVGDAIKMDIGLQQTGAFRCGIIVFYDVIVID